MEISAPPKTTKICGLCKLEKPISDYRIRTGKTTPQSYCKDCSKLHAKNRYYHRKSEPGFVEMRRVKSLNANYLMTYGISKDDKVKWLEQVGKKCEICHRHLESITEAKIDHIYREVRNKRRFKKLCLYCGEITTQAEG